MRVNRELSLNAALPQPEEKNMDMDKMDDWGLISAARWLAKRAVSDPCCSLPLQTVMMLWLIGHPTVFEQQQGEHTGGHSFRHLKDSRTLRWQPVSDVIKVCTRDWWATKTTRLSIRGDEQPWSSGSAAQELQRQWKYSRGPMSLKQINQESDWRPPSVKKNKHQTTWHTILKKS